MRNSTYITDQQLADIDAEGKATPNGKPTTGQTAWYKISVQATQLGYDKKRHDHAYKMKFVISPYAINTMQSEFFPNSRFRGAHKRYNYCTLATGNNCCKWYNVHPLRLGAIYCWHNIVSSTIRNRSCIFRSNSYYNLATIYLYANGWHNRWFLCF
jgi:hypothetical protein